MAITWESVCRVPRGMVDLKGTLDTPKYFSGIVMFVIILSAVNSVGPTLGTPDIKKLWTQWKGNI